MGKHLPVPDAYVPLLETREQRSSISTSSSLYELAGFFSGCFSLLMDLKPKCCLETTSYAESWVPSVCSIQRWGVGNTALRRGENTCAPSQQSDHSLLMTSSLPALTPPRPWTWPVCFYSDIWMEGWNWISLYNCISGIGGQYPVICLFVHSFVQSYFHPFTPCSMSIQLVKSVHSSLITNINMSIFCPHSVD